MKKYAATLALAVIDSVRGAVHEWEHGEPVWVSADGKVWRYSEMGDRHLRNSIRMLQREGEAGSTVCRALEAERDRRRGLSEGKE